MVGFPAPQVPGIIRIILFLDAFYATPCVLLQVYPGSDAERVIRADADTLCQSGYDHLSGGMVIMNIVFAP